MDVTIPVDLERNDMMGHGHGGGDMKMHGHAQ
jgi:hypothetical protein